MINLKALDSFPIIETQRLILRNLQFSDKEQILELHSNLDVNQFIYRNALHTLEDATKNIEINHQFFQKKWSIAWAATIKKSNENPNDELIGICSFNLIDAQNHRAEIGAELLPKHWRTGVAIEGFLALLRFGFETMKLHSISAKVCPKNLSTISLLEKLGFDKEAHLKDRTFMNGKYQDVCLYSILEDNQRLEEVLKKYQSFYQLNF